MGTNLCRHGELRMCQALGERELPVHRARRWRVRALWRLREDLRRRYLNSRHVLGRSACICPSRDSSVIGFLRSVDASSRCVPLGSPMYLSRTSTEDDCQLRPHLEHKCGLWCRHKLPRPLHKSAKGRPRLGNELSLARRFAAVHQCHQCGNRVVDRTSVCTDSPHQRFNSTRDRGPWQHRSVRESSQLPSYCTSWAARARTAAAAQLVSVATPRWVRVATP